MEKRRKRRRYAALLKDKGQNKDWYWGNYMSLTTIHYRRCST